ncbi:hypothetical protein OHT52_13120 [Streptomyces sp. NBC_00247]|uniref:hypothetical protein n=1 Tax=Streptomyces sp. NBC_00247 TaxID=2975689 RepID=UPI002E2A7DAC|nr:hypothetical protein [Streptomyces sp. NBC_00247]
MNPGPERSAEPSGSAGPSGRAGQAEPTAEQAEPAAEQAEPAAEQAEPAAEQAEPAEPTGRTRGGDEEHRPPVHTPSGRYAGVPGPAPTDEADDARGGGGVTGDATGEVTGDATGEVTGDASEQHDQAPRSRDDLSRPREKAPSSYDGAPVTGTLTQLFPARTPAVGFGRGIGSVAASGDGIDLSGIDMSGGLNGGGLREGGLSGSGSGGRLLRGSGPGGGPVEAGDEDDTTDEQVLRRLLRGAVHDLEPAENALDQLHRAVPARRARRRQAVVGAAAAALLIGTAVPALLHVANSGSVATAAPSLAGHGQNSQSQQGDASGAAVGEKPSAGQPAQGADGRHEGIPDPSGTPTATDAPADSDSAHSGAVSEEELASIAALPACAPDQLGVASASTGSADANGTVYGSFRISNTSATDCSVSTAGTVAFTTTGAADATKIAVVQHVAGDPAAGLPDPAAEAAAMLLKPWMSYEVKFAFVPSDTCPTATAPTPTPTESPTGTGTGEDQASSVETQSLTAQSLTAQSLTTQSLTADAVPSEGTIAVTHTPEAGAPAAETTITHACAGTIYRTGILAAS